MKLKLPLIVVAVLFAVSNVFGQTLYDVRLGTDNKKITEVQIEFNGSTLTQTSGYGTASAPSNRQTLLPVLMNYVKVNEGGNVNTLNFFNKAGAFVSNNNFTSSATGVGVYNEGVETLTSNGVAAWEQEMQSMVTTRNALHYLFYDGSSNIPSGYDFDVLWSRALTNDDNLVVSERNGNTFFTVVPLDINGNVITSARALRFGKVDGTSSPDGNKKYDWNIGYGSKNRNASQPQYFSVVDVELFNANQDIYGFRIDNLGDADVKFYGISDNTFEDNPRNPNVPGLIGNVFNDTDGLNDNTVNGSGISTPGGTQLYASLLNSSNTILSTIPIESDGSYEFLNVMKNTTYTVVLHTNQNGSTTPNLPLGWINTGENVGTAAGNDGSVNGILSATVNTTIRENVNFGIQNSGACGLAKIHAGNCWTTEITSVLLVNGKYDVEILVTYTGSGGGPGGCKELSHYSIDAVNNSFSNIAWAQVSGNVSGNMVTGTGNNDPFNKRGFKLDNVSGIGGSKQGSFKITYTLDYLQDQQFLAKAGNDYTQLASFTTAEFQSVLGCSVAQCDVADNTTATASITEGDTKTLTATPAGGTWSIVSGGGSINGNVYTPADINTNTQVTIKYTLAASGNCASTSDDVTFTVTPVCITADNTTATASITEGETKTLTGNPSGGTWSIVSGGGSINGNVYTPADITTNTQVKIRYTIAADGSCAASTDDVTFTVTPICVVATNDTATANLVEGDTRELEGSPLGGTWSIVSGGGSINGNVYTPADVNTDTTVIIRYTIAASGSCAASSDDVTFTVEDNPNCTQFYPTSAALGFNVFTQNSLTLSTNETEGAVATGGDLTISGNYQISTNVQGQYTVNGYPIGLLVGGKVNYNSGNSLQINQNSYVKIGDANGSVAWYRDQNNASSPIRITKNSTYNSSPRILLQNNDVFFGASTTTNPVFESNLIDFNAAFQSLQSNAATLAAKANNAQLTNPNGNAIGNTGLPNQVKINLQNGVNYLNVTGSDMNNVSVFTYNNKPNASRILVVNVDAPGSFTWNVWNQAGVGQQDAPFIIYNFYNTTTLNIAGNSTIVGSVLAPNADIVKTVNQSNIEGQVIGKSFVHSGGEVHSANFNTPIDVCTPPTNNRPPTAEFSFTGDACLSSNSFDFTNTSNTGGVAQPNDPITYSWDFGDGTNSTLMNPSKTYANPGTYTVTLTATNTFGTDTTTSQVTVLPAVATPVISKVLTNSGNGTATYEFTLDNDTAYDSFTWEVEGEGSGLYADQKTITVNYTQAGTYYVKVSAVKDNCDVVGTLSVTLSSNEVGCGGNCGGVESESLGDAISKIYVGRKKKSEPTIFVKNASNLYDKAKLQAKQPYQGKGQTMLDMFPTELVAGNVANVTSPTDILDYTIADEVLSVDFSVDGKTKGVVLGVKTSDKVYNHTKASCDRLRGAEVLNVIPVRLEGYDFLMQGLKQRNGMIEYAISFAVAKNNNDTDYTIQTNWYVNEYTKFNDVYNFQVWTTNPTDTQKLVVDILNNLRSFIPVKQVEVQKVPKTYAAKIYRDKRELVVLLRSTEVGLQTEVVMEEIYSETANNVKFRYNPISSKKEQELRIDVADGYEYDGLIKVNGEVEDAFYHADGNWGLDFDSRYTTIQDYFVYNNFDREYNTDEHAVNRNVELKASSDYDYLTLYKSLLPGTLSADYSEYKYLSFTAKGSGIMELGLIKSSIQEWKEQYRILVDFSEEEQTYYVPFEAFTSVGTESPIIADDLTTITFTFLPVEANTTELDLQISDVKFTKTAVEEQIVNKIETFENNFVAYPNPSEGNMKLLLFSEEDTEVTVTLTDILGKTISTFKTNLIRGKNELEANFNVRPGVMLLKVSSPEKDYGTSKILFR